MSEKIGTKERILRRAVELFSRKGYTGTSLEEIAESCSITKPAIYYHFKDKASLYEAVLCSQFGLLSERISRETAGGEAVEKLEAYIHAFGEFLIRNPAFSAIFSREIVSGGASMPEGCVRFLAEIFSRLAEILEQGVEEGAFAPEPPFLVQMMIVTPLCAYHASRPLRERVAGLLGDGEGTPEVDFSDIIDRLAEKIVKALRC